MRLRYIQLSILTQYELHLLILFQVSSLLEEREQLLECRDSHESAMEELKRVREDGETQMEELVGKLEDKSKAGEWVQRSQSHFSPAFIPCSLVPRLLPMPKSRERAWTI